MCKWITLSILGVRVCKLFKVYDTCLRTCSLYSASSAFVLTGMSLVLESHYGNGREGWKGGSLSTVPYTLRQRENYEGGSKL